LVGGNVGVRPMNWDRIEGNWKEFKGKVKERWGKLTDDDLEVVEGRRDQLAGQIRKRYGLAKDEADRQIEDWMREPGVLDDWNDRRAILDM
jgi:uncharacterized protein YjbJ (UPF0337 family)